MGKDVIGFCGIALLFSRIRLDQPDPYRSYRVTGRVGLAVPCLASRADRLER